MKKITGISLVLALVAGCTIASMDPHGGVRYTGVGDPAGSFAAAAEAGHEEHERDRVRLVEAPRARAAARSQDTSRSLRSDVVRTALRCLSDPDARCPIPPQGWETIVAVSRGLAVDEAITVSASDGSGGYGYGDGDGFWRAQAAQLDGSSHAIPGWVSESSGEIRARLDQIEQRTEAVVRVQRDTSEELAGHLDRNRRSRRER